VEEEVFLLKLGGDVGDGERLSHSGYVVWKRELRIAANSGHWKMGSTDVGRDHHLGKGKVLTDKRWVYPIRRRVTVISSLRAS